MEKKQWWGATSGLVSVLVVPYSKKKVSTSKHSRILDGEGKTNFEPLKTLTIDIILHM